MKINKQLIFPENMFMYGENQGSVGYYSQPDPMTIFLRDSPGKKDQLQLNLIKAISSFFESKFLGLSFYIEQEKQICSREILKFVVMNCRRNRCQGTGNYPLAMIKTLDERVNKETYFHGTKVRVLHNLVKSSEKGKRYDVWSDNTHIALEVELKPVYD